MTMRFNPPPTWPTPPAGWTPPPGWQPDPSWPAAPEGWQFWLEDVAPAAHSAGHQFARPRDHWAAIGKPITGIGAVKVRMDDVHLFVERGTISTDVQQVPLAFIMDVDASQSPSQKLRGVSNITVHVNRQGRLEVLTLTDLQEFRQGVEIINEAARQARVAVAQRANTHNFNHVTMALPTPQPPTAPPPPPPSSSPLEMLERLDRLRLSGALTDDEFAQHKAQLLALSAPQPDTRPEIAP